MDNAQQTRSAFIALLGIPNAGKSTLLNQLVGTKVSIVTHKVQTTRNRIRGIVMHNHAQLIFIDTPGIFEPKRRLDRAMVASAWAGAKEADYVLFLMDVQTGLTQENLEVLEKLKTLKAPKILVFNKVDCIAKEKLLKLTASIKEIDMFERVFMISALRGSGCTDLLEYLSEKADLGPLYFPEDQISDIPLRLMASEITREKMFLRLHEELPYTSTVETELWEERKDKSIKIMQTIYVERDSQKKIVIGKNGATIKAIGQKVREELSMMLETKVHLFLFVKVRSNWSEDPEHYRNSGLEFSK